MFNCAELLSCTAAWCPALQLEAVAALAQPQETLGITNHHSPAQATNKDAAYDGVGPLLCWCSPRS